MRITTALLAAAMAAGLALPARADHPGPDWIPLDQVVRKLSEAGYGNIRKIEADDGAWEAKASKDGREFKLLVDPRSGAISVKPRKQRD